MKRSPAAYKKACREVDERSRGWCEANVPGVCPRGLHRGEQHHHVVLRSQGGPDEAWNLLHLCSAVHTWAHDVDRAEAERLGIIKRSGQMRRGERGEAAGHPGEQVAALEDAGGDRERDHEAEDGDDEQHDTSIHEASSG